MTKYTQISLSETNAYDYINKIMYLEENLGKNISFKILNPDELMPYKDDLNVLTKKIAEFIGLDSVFIITKGAKDKGGEIEYGENVSFIDINTDVCKSFNQTIAVLAHEIVHKYLRKNGLFYSIEIENEVLTDIATVYVGLGKLSLNGNCVKETIFNERAITTRISKVGYLDLESFCFVYLLICQLRSIDKNVAECGLKKSVIEMFGMINDSSLFSNMIYEMDRTHKVVVTTSNELNILEQKIEYSNRLIDKINELVNSLNTENSIVHKNTEMIIDKLKLLNSNEEYNPVLRKIYNIKLIMDLHTILKKQKSAVETLAIKTKELERLYGNGKGTEKKKKFLWF